MTRGLTTSATISGTRRPGEGGARVDPRRRRRVGIPQGALALAALGLMLTASAHAQAARPRAAVVAAATATPVDGCRRPIAPGTSTVTLRVAGRERFARLYTPRGYPSEHALPLVVNLHGSGATAAVQEEQASRM